MEEYKELVQALKRGAASLACGNYLRRMSSIQRQSTLTAASYSRLKRKYEKIEEIFVQSQCDWNQTFLVLLFRSMDSSQNRDAYERLARLVPYRVIERERSSLRAIEALLLGTSGLLSVYRDDSYIRSLKEEYFYLAQKYELMPMRRREWDLSRCRPHNHPVLRIVQIAKLLVEHNFLVNSVLECKTCGDIEKLFGVEASEYWSNHFIPAQISSDIPKRIGREKCHLLGINLVVQFQFAYAYHTSKEELRSDALTLLEDIPAENNRFMRRWAERGVYATNAFESQALLQIATEYCGHELCEECPIYGYLMASKA